MELERHLIERRDFPAAKRGYDPEAVERHLAEIAESVTELKRRAQRPRETTLAGAAADQVRAIVEAAERSASDISRQAEEEARQAREAASQEAQSTREQANAESAEQIDRVERAAADMLERASSIEADLDGLVRQVRSGAEALVESLRSESESLAGTLRGGAESLRSELEQVRAGLGDVRSARTRGATRRIADAGVGPAAAAAESAEAPVEEPGPPDAEAEVVAETRRAVEEAEEPAAEIPEEEPVEDEPVDDEPVEDEPVEDAVEDGASEGARLIALNMALNGTPRDETASYLSDNFDLPDQDAILDDVYSRV